MNKKTKLKIKIILNNISYLTDISKNINIINNKDYYNILEEKLISKGFKLISSGDWNILNKDKININIFYYDPKIIKTNNDRYYQCLDIIGMNNNYILINDDFIIIDKLLNFLNYAEIYKNFDVVGLSSCNKNNEYHYYDSLRYFSNEGIKKWSEFYKKYSNNSNLNSDLSFEFKYINSQKKICMYEFKQFNSDIHYDDEENKNFIVNENYPIISVEKVLFDINNYKNNKNTNIINCLPEYIYYKLIKIENLIKSLDNLYI